MTGVSPALTRLVCRRKHRRESLEKLSELMSDAINVQVIMQEIRERVRKQSAIREQMGVSSGLGLPDLIELERVSRDLYHRRVAIGQMPPGPPTLRGRVGSLLVRMVRRVLFWQTLQLQEFHAAVVEGYDRQLDALKRVVAEAQYHRQRMQELWTQVAEVSAEIERINRALGTQQAAIGHPLYTTIKELQQALGTETAARKDLARRVDAESAAWKELQQALGAKNGDAHKDLTGSGHGVRLQGGVRPPRRRRDGAPSLNL